MMEGKIWILASIPVDVTFEGANCSISVPVSVSVIFAYYFST
jgi:hypothetical protein